TEKAHQLIRQTTRLPHFSYNATYAIRTHRGDGGYMILPILIGKIVTNFVAMTRFEIHVDIRPLTAIAGKKPIKVQVMGKCIDPAQPQAISNRRVHDRTAPRKLNILIPRPAADILHHQKV